MSFIYPFFYSEGSPNREPQGHVPWPLIALPEEGLLLDPSRSRGSAAQPGLSSFRAKRP